MDDAGPTLGVGGVVQDDRGRLLVVRRGNAPARGRWTLPGGKVERGERLAEAVRRELSEETGLDVDVGDPVGVTEVVAEDRHYVIVDLRATVIGGELRAGDDAAEVRWMGRGDLEGVATTPGLLDFLDEHGVELAP